MFLELPQMFIILMLRQYYFHGANSWGKGIEHLPKIFDICDTTSPCPYLRS
jgi:hypothetical protein